MGHLRDPGRVRIVDHEHGVTDSIGKPLLQIVADATPVYVRRSSRNTVLDTRREGATDGPFPLEQADELLDRLTDPFRRGRLRRSDAMPFSSEFTRRDVDRCTLYSRSADVKSKYFHDLILRSDDIPSGEHIPCITT